MNGQLLFRKTAQKNHKGEEVFVVIGVVTMNNYDNIKDGHKYDILDVIVNNEQDYSEMNDKLSPEDLLSSKIWKT